MQTRILGMRHRDTKATAGRLAGLLDATNRGDEAAALRKQYGLTKPSTKPSTKPTTRPVTTRSATSRLTTTATEK